MQKKNSDQKGNLKKVDKTYKIGSLPTTENILKNFPYFYYNTELFSDFHEMLNKKFDMMKLNEDEKKRNLESSSEEAEKSLKEKIEGKIKSKYNLIIPAILIELAENGKDSIEFQKEDLKSLLTSLGEIKHIEINGGIAYVLYEHYFSALLAYNVLNEIISAEKKKSIAVKLFTKEEDEQKQKKSQDKNNRRVGRSLLPILDPDVEDHINDKDQTGEIQDKSYSILNKKTGASEESLVNDYNSIRNVPKEKLIESQKHDFSVMTKDIRDGSLNATHFNEISGTILSFTSANYSKEENKSHSIFMNDIFSPQNREDLNKIDNDNSSIKETDRLQTFQFQSSPKLNQNNSNGFFMNYYKPSNIADTSQMSSLNSNQYPNYSNQTINRSVYDMDSQYLNYNIAYPIPNFLHFKTATSRIYLLKYVCNYEIQIQNEPEFQVTRRLIGNKGAYLKKILYDTCIKYHDFTTKVRLRGKGSGYKEGPNMQESEDPLQLCISSLNYFNYVKCCETIESFLNQIYYEYFLFLFNRKELVDSCPKKISKYEYVINRH